MNAVKKDTDDNWALRLSNLKTLAKSLAVIYREIIGQEADIEEVDLSAAAREGAGQSNSLAHLAELVLGVAVQCKDKHIYIGRIMEKLDQSEQLGLMYLIDDIIHRYPEVSSPIGRTRTSSNSNELSDFQAQLQMQAEANAKLEEALNEVKKENGLFRAAMENLEKEKNSLQAKLREKEAFEARQKKDELGLKEKVHRSHCRQSR